MGCNQNSFQRMIIKQANGIPTVPATDDHQDGSWLVTDLYVGEWYQDLDTGLIYNRTPSGIVSLSDLIETIFSGGTMTADSTIDQDGNDLAFVNGGKFLIGLPSSPAPVRLHVASDNLGAIIAAVNQALLLSSMAGNALDLNAPNGLGLRSFSPANIFRKLATGVIPSPDPSSIIDVYSDDQGVRIYPPHSDRTVIVDPADGLGIYYVPLNRDEIFDPFFEWMPARGVTTDWGFRLHYEAAFGGVFILDADGGGSWERYNDGVSPAFLYAVKTANIAGESYSSLQQSFTALKASANKKMYRANIYPIDFNGGGTDFIFVSGVVNDVYPSGWASGIFFLYDAPNQGGNWCCVVLTTGSGPTYIDSSVPVDGGSGDGLYRLKWTQDGEEVKFYINGGLVATVSDYVATGQFGVTNEVYTASGGVSKRIGIDFVEYIEKFDTPRYVNY